MPSISLRFNFTLRNLFPFALAAVLAAVAQEAARGDDPAPGPEASRPVPEGLNFANGLLRARRYELAAEEYERFLKEGATGADAADARFGLATARLLLGQYPEARRNFETFLRLAPNHPRAADAWFRVGECAYYQGDFPAARQALETFTSGHSKHRFQETALPYLGDVYFRLGELARARRTYEQALTRFPEGRLKDKTRFGLGQVLAAQGQTDAALALFRQLAEQGGRDWSDRAWSQIGQIEAGAGRYAEAVRAFETLETVAPKSRLRSEARLYRAEALIRLGKHAEAEALLRPLMAEGSQTIAARAAYSLGISQLDRGQAAEARATFDDARARSPEAPLAPAMLFRSAEAVQKADPGDARARFLKVVEEYPKSDLADAALLRAAGLALDAAQAAAARELAQKLIERSPKGPLRADARLLAARADLAENKPQAAIEALNALLAEETLSPATGQAARYYLVLAYRDAGQAAKATEVLDALAQSPAAAPVATNALFLVGQAHFEAGRFAEAVPPLEKYLAARPKGDVADYALHYLCLAHHELGQADAARADLDQLAERFPRSKTLAPTRLRLAEAAFAAKQYDRAAALYAGAAETDTPALKAKALSSLGWSLYKQGKGAEAATAFAGVLDAAPDDPHLAPEAVRMQGHALEAAGQTDAALAAFDRVAEKYPQSDQALPALLARARLLARTNHAAEAAAAYAKYAATVPPRKADADAPDPGPAPLDEVLAEWGWTLLDAGQEAEADRVFRRLLDEFPASPRAADARLNLAESAAQARRYAEVLPLLEPLVAPGAKVEPTLLQSALYRLGRTQVERKDWPAAAQAFDRLVREFPDGPFRREGRFWRAEVAYQAGDAKAAEAAFAALVAEPAPSSGPEPWLATARLRRIQCLVQLERWQDALQAADSLKSDLPDYPLMAEVDYARGRALQSLARFDEARAAYDAVIQARKAGELAARAQFLRGETYFHQKDYRAALREFYKVELLYDAPAWQASALLEAGKVHEQLAQWPDAVETYERLRSKFPKDPHAAEATARLEAARKHLPDRVAGEG